MMTRFAMLGVCCLCLSAIAGPVWCGPNAEELKSFYNLMPDYSIVNGATSPALSPDGKRLAFYAGTSGIWILPDVDGFVRRCEDGKSYPTPTPWELRVKKAKAGGQYVPLEAEPNTVKYARCIDWSPDGKSLAFVYDSRLYVAENLDFDKKTADTRLLADLLTDADLTGDAPSYSVTGNIQGPILTPRWSPDGKKIAFTRWKVGTSNTVCVVDVESGQETVLADDGAQPQLVWLHPWSPDGDCVVYGAGTQSGGMLGVKVKSVDGSKTRVVKSEMAGSPSWSPASDEIAFTAMPLSSGSLEGTDLKAIMGLARKAREAGMGIFVTGSHGENSAPATRSDPEVKRQIAAAVALMDDKDKEVFERDYGFYLTADQMARLKSGDLDWAERALVTMLVQLKTEAERIGGECGEAMKKALEKNPSSFEEAMELLDDSNSELSEKCKGQSVQLGMAWASGSTPVLVELSPAWSPDGRRIAFTRSGLHENQEDVWVVDRDSRKERRVFSSGNVRYVEWTADGKSLMVAGERDLGFQRNESPSDSENTVVSWPSYSEVWLLTLK